MRLPNWWPGIGFFLLWALGLLLHSFDGKSFVTLFIEHAWIKGFFSLLVLTVFACWAERSKDRYRLKRKEAERQKRVQPWL